MANAKKTDTPAEMNIFQKLLAVRTEFMEADKKKSGRNTHAEFLYFELKDIVPVAQPIFAKYGLILLPTFPDGKAVAHVVNVDNPEQFIDFEIPLKLLSEPAKFRMNEIQGIGSAVTYYRRYLYMVVLDLVENDAFDGQDGKKNLLPAEEPPKKEPPKKPVTNEERTAIKAEIIENGKATEEDVKQLKTVLKTLMNTDPEQEDFVQEIAVKTNGFNDLTHDQCASLISGVTEMIEAYSKVN